MVVAKRRSTATSNFGVGGRESHDASGFYGRFRPPDLTTDDTVLAPDAVGEPFVCADARDMAAVADGSVALVVTSPPYFAGKQYEEELGRNGIPASYLEYLDLLTEVFRDCVRALEPGGRIAVNVANLGRKPYRSLSADVIRILQDELGLLLRGEIIWQKGEGASGSCAWGSFQSAANPVIRDITERVIVASKGRFDRARAVKDRGAAGLPNRNDISADEFMAQTLDIWSIPTESARRVGHPAPFPVELPEKLIALYTFQDDLVLDPFMGSGSTLVAAARNGRRYIGYDLDESYVTLARHRVAEALGSPGMPGTPEPSAETDDDPQRRAGREGRAAGKIAADVLEEAGFEIISRNHRVRGTGVTVSFAVADANGSTWYVDVSGANTRHRGGLSRMDAVWKSLGRAHALRGHVGAVPLVLLTTHLPRRPSAGDTALRAAGPAACFDVVAMLSDEGLDRLKSYAKGAPTHDDGQVSEPELGFWTPADLARHRQPWPSRP
ncbi:MAG: DNA methyltransferase [Acidimicrobiales bacterium]